ncbi:hypothetical protein K457DRAFT_130527 [Linnemannia elongata AG-77]|uniref:Uncharacterized protein n=1 Tax=Linnemannia elongata AG-77 TaxID=1314771 RepID=A0A197JED1_9FUNG|nr:hypothetical protein K457DRAFT_130527 [Linnemannia elongata AG-77]
MSRKLKEHTEAAVLSGGGHDQCSVEHQTRDMGGTQNAESGYAAETEGAKDESKMRMQPSRGVAAAQQADEEQSIQTPQVLRIAEPFERYDRELAQYMSRKVNMQFPPFLSVPQTIAET